MKRILALLPLVFLICGCVSQPDSITGNIVADKSEEVFSLTIDKADCGSGNVFIRNTGQVLKYDDIRIFADGEMVHPCDVGWLKYWDSQEGNVTFNEEKIIGAVLGNRIEESVEIFYREEFMDSYSCK